MGGEARLDLPAFIRARADLAVGLADAAHPRPKRLFAGRRRHVSQAVHCPRSWHRDDAAAGAIGIPTFATGRNPPASLVQVSRRSSQVGLT